MEMLYSCKKEIEVHKGRLNRKFRAAYNKQKQKKGLRGTSFESCRIRRRIKNFT